MEREVFQQVQALLERQTHRRRARPSRVSTMLLKGLVFDADGEAMSPTFSQGRGGRLYRYYVSTPALTGQGKAGDGRSIRRVAAQLVETLVTDCTDRVSACAGEVKTCLQWVEVHPYTVELLLRRDGLFKRASNPQAQVEVLRRRLADEEWIDSVDGSPDIVRVTLPRRLKLHGGRCLLLDAQERGPVTSTTPTPR